MTPVERLIAAMVLLAIAVAPPAAAQGAGIADLMKAADSGNLAKVKELLASDPSLAAKADPLGRTALHKAATNEVAQALIAAKADVNATAGFGQTPLWEAASDGRKGAAEALIAAGAKVDAAANDGSTALHRAATFNEAVVAHLLLAAHADVGRKNDRGRTPLAVAAANCKTVMVKILVDAKSDVTMPDGEGKTPVDLAAQCRESQGREPILALLRAGHAGG